MTDGTTVFNSPKVNPEDAPQPDTITTPIIGNPDQGNKTIDIDVVFADQLAAIKNDQGAPKYGTVNEALHALRSAQEHIKTLESENSTYKTKITGETNMQAILDALKSNKDEQGKQTGQPQIDVKDIEGVTMEAIQKYEAQKTATSNQQEVGSKLAEKFGENAETEYKKKAEALGLTAKDFDALAARSPSAVLAFFGETKSTFNKNVQSSVNTSAMDQQSSKTPSQFDGLMYGGKTEDMTNAWQQVKGQVNAQFNI